MRFLTAAFFLAYLGLGLLVFGDYGISWDEPMHRQQGRRMVEYVTEGNLRGVEHHMRYHGPLLDTALWAMEMHLALDDLGTVYRARHLVYFLVFFAGVFFFYLLATELLGAPGLGLLSAVLLVASPRLFADSFYNPKDVPCLALFNVGMYTLVKYAEEKNARRALTHAIATSLLITVRLVGLLVPFFTTVLAIRDKRAVRSFALYAVVTAGLVILLWPTLWRNPPYHFLRAVRSYGQYEGWPGAVLYMGEEIRSGRIPWHYVPVWIGITTPVSYVLCFAVGLFRLVKSPTLLWGTVAAWLVAPLLAVILLRSVVYDTWRHVYFVYPAFLLIAALGVKWLLSLKRRAVTAVLTTVLALDILATAAFMIRNHPHQHLFFNPLAGGIRGAKDRFDLDYWGVTYAAALAHLVETRPGETLRIHVAQSPGKYNTALLSPADRMRVVLLDDPAEASYYLTTFRFADRAPGPFSREIYSVTVDDVPVLTVYGR